MIRGASLFMTCLGSGVRRPTSSPQFRLRPKQHSGHCGPRKGAVGSPDDQFGDGAMQRPREVEAEERAVRPGDGRLPTLKCGQGNPAPFADRDRFDAFDGASVRGQIGDPCADGLALAFPECGRAPAGDPANQAPVCAPCRSKPRIRRPVISPPQADRITARCWHMPLFQSCRSCSSLPQKAFR